MVKSKLARPRLACVRRSEMNKGHREQEQAHGSKDSGTGASAAFASVVGNDKDRGDGQKSEANRDGEERDVMKPGRWKEQLGEVGNHRSPAQQISGKPHSAKP